MQDGMKYPNMILNIQTALFILCLIFKSHDALAQSHTTLVAALQKDTATSLYKIILAKNNRYIIDLSAPFSWQRCSSPRPRPLPCFTTECIQAQYLPTPYCSLPNTNTPDPCICMVNPTNPVAKSCANDQLTTANVTLSWTDGDNPTSKITFNNTYLSCAPASLFKSLPRNVLGLASLSLAPLSLPSQFSPLVSKKFAMCLPSTISGNGIIFFGDGPYNLIPQTTFDASSLVSYTPLLTNPKNVDYFIGIKALSVSGNPISMSPFEGVKLSTVVPYMTLRSDVYTVFVKMFNERMKGVPRTKKVKPFTMCYKASAIGFSRVGLHVPQIDLEFDNGKNWTIFGANSMKQVGGDSACLAVLDGGRSADYKVVIGSFQMEENLVVFDLDRLRFGFSSSLYFERLSCGNFNFTRKG